jgi:glutamate 5-kinase
MSTKRTTRAATLAQAKRVVVKLGTAVVMREDGKAAQNRLRALAKSIADLMRGGREVLLVSSGAVGLGRSRLGISEAPPSLPLKQACAAVGQGALMALYSDALEGLGVAVAQVLLTEEDFSNRTRYLNLRSTLTQLIELGVLPIINENDTVSTAELESESTPYLRVNFGDNDRLSALVASKIEADVLVMLTDVPGLYTVPPDEAGATLIPLVKEITPEIEALAQAPPAPQGGKVGRGGIRTKLEAASIAMHSGCAAVIASGKQAGVLDRIFAGEEVGTFFLPYPGLSGKRRWIAFATTVRAALVVNAGAMRALTGGKASLLPAGVLEVRGEFDRGDVVSILDEGAHELGRGIVNYSSDEARKVSGQRSDKIDELIEGRNYDALITRDNIAILERS